MREAERREKAALDYAKAVESKRKTLDSKFGQVNKDYVTQFEKELKTEWRWHNQNYHQR